MEVRGVGWGRGWVGCQLFYWPNAYLYSFPGTSSSENIVQEPCESRGDRPGLSILTGLLAAVDVKIY